MRTLSRYVRITSRPRLALAMVIAFSATSALTVAVADAVPKGPAGQTCKSSGTTTVNGKEEGTNKPMTCTADYCKYDECETSGPNIGKCSEKTHYSNVRDCKAAARSMNPSFQVPQGQLAPLTVQPSQPPAQRAPMAPKGGVMRRGVEGEQQGETAPSKSDSAGESGGAK